ncbi:MAG: undecaprenyl-diphosphate phosphatase [Acetobacter sp.]|nr:undecaprenyl-diphosphate phosphatase [Acetobacter sp.]MBR2124669.1 undecaprenyl-diphosphate phosphatase [Acetobacter sp.]
MSFFQMMVLAILQGATELFPVSSLGHAVIVSALLHWDSLRTSQATFLPFLVMLHLGTSIALLVFFWQDWFALFKGVCGLSGGRIRAESLHILTLLIMATVPAVIIGGLFEHFLRHVFGAASSAAVFLCLNGLLLLMIERLRNGTLFKNQKPKKQKQCLAELSIKDAVIIGLFQCLAFFPGFSRSGATIGGGILRGLHYDSAARFSFLMAEPVIVAATVREAFKMRHMTFESGQLSMIFIAALVAGLSALASTAFLMHYFRDHDQWALSPFGWYCLIAGGSAWTALHIMA